MQYSHQLAFGLVTFSSTTSLTQAAKPSSSCAPFPPTMTAFSSAFKQPLPPNISTEFKASLIQHKWNTNLSHIIAGYIYTSPTVGKVRVDEAYDGAIASSLFDYTNISSQGLVNNIMYSYSPSIAFLPTIFEGFVNPGFPLFSKTILGDNNAVFTGFVKRDKNGVVASWSILYQGSIPVTVFLNECNTLVGYDFFSPDERTRAITEFFDVVLGPIKDEVFKLPSK